MEWKYNVAEGGNTQVKFSTSINSIDDISKEIREFVHRAPVWKLNEFGFSVDSHICGYMLL